jgi:hypothetical protein
MVLPDSPAVQFGGGESVLRDWAAVLVDQARTEGVELTGDNGLLTALVREVLQTGLEVEMTDHLGYESDGRVTSPVGAGVHPYLPVPHNAWSEGLSQATSSRPVCTRGRWWVGVTVTKW